MRICEECSRSFQPSSGHLRCPICRSPEKVKCKCGALKQPTSASCYPCRNDALNQNGNWKGGKTLHKRGYVMRRSPGHPRAGSNPYVFEHILVIESVIGRYLVAGETVHHLNGVRNDNRPENLELWTRPQPAGIRVSDALQWAHALIDRYENTGSDFTSNNTHGEP